MPNPQVTNLWVTNWRATGQQVQTPQYAADVQLDYLDEAGQAQSWAGTLLFPNDLADVPAAWLKEQLVDLVYRAARLKLGIDQRTEP